MSDPAPIAPYRITGKPGEAGMGAVYRAAGGKGNAEVAIKVIPDTVARFTREAHALAALKHPNIAAVHGTLLD